MTAALHILRILGHSAFRAGTEADAAHRLRMRENAQNKKHHIAWCFLSDFSKNNAFFQAQPKSCAEKD